MKIPLF